MGMLNDPGVGGGPVGPPGLPFPRAEFPHAGGSLVVIKGGLAGLSKSFSVFSSTKMMFNKILSLCLLSLAALASGRPSDSECSVDKK